jgi:hypothetical protein
MLTYVKAIFVWAVMTKKTEQEKLYVQNSANNVQHSVHYLPHDVRADMLCNLFSTEISSIKINISIKIMPICAFPTKQGTQ